MKQHDLVGGALDTGDLVVALLFIVSLYVILSGSINCSVPRIPVL